MTIWLPDLAGVRGPRYLAIADALERATVDGRLAVGTRLPPQRELAWVLGVTVGTVSRAYAEAIRRGLADGQVGRGTFIVDRRAMPKVVPASAGTTNAAPAPPRDWNGQWFSLHGEATAGIDLAPNYPSSEGMAEMMTEALARLGDRSRLATLVNYAHPAGRVEHRAAMARWLETRDIAVSAEQLLIAPGCQGGLSAVISAITRPGDTMLCESLSWPGMVSFAWMRGLRAQGVAMDRDGIIPDAFEEACARYRPAAAYLMPTMHNPTTTVLPAARRERLSEIARRHRVFLVEDDVYGFLCPESPPPLRAYAPDRVIYVSSLSKAVAPGLRVGCVVGPEAVMPGIGAALRTMLLMSAPLQSELAMHLIDSGLAAKAADRQRAVAKRRQLLAAAALGPLYDPRWAGNGSAFHVWLPLPEPWRIHDFVMAMRDRGVAVTPGDSFHVDSDHHDDRGAMTVPRNAVRVCLSSAENDDDIRHGLDLVARTLRQPVREVLPVI